MTDRLKTGERLSIDDKLVSANGQFTLWMQPDGNLVLYQGEPAVGSAYWATNTEWLSPNERPTHVDMQADAHLVMYDPNMVPRWGSGTWGPAFLQPYIMLRDDGNLVIYHSGILSLWASGGPGGVGAIPPVGFVKEPSGDLNSTVSDCGRMPLIVSGPTDILPPSSSAADADGVAYVVTEQKRRLVESVVEHAFLQDIGALGVWPGQVIQGGRSCPAMSPGSVLSLGRRGPSRSRPTSSPPRPRPRALRSLPRLRRTSTTPVGASSRLCTRRIRPDC